MGGLNLLVDQSFHRAAAAGRPDGRDQRRRRDPPQRGLRRAVRVRRQLRGDAEDRRGRSSTIRPTPLTTTTCAAGTIQSIAPGAWEIAGRGAVPPTRRRARPGRAQGAALRADPGAHPGRRGGGGQDQAARGGRRRSASGFRTAPRSRSTPPPTARRSSGPTSSTGSCSTSSPDETLLRGQAGSRHRRRLGDRRGGGGGPRRARRRRDRAGPQADLRRRSPKATRSISPTPSRLPRQPPRSPIRSTP